MLLIIYAAMRHAAMFMFFAEPLCFVISCHERLLATPAMPTMKSV